MSEFGSYFCWRCSQYHEHEREQTYKTQEKIRQAEEQVQLFSYKIAAYEALQKWHAPDVMVPE